MKDFTPVCTINLGGYGKIVEGNYKNKYPAISKEIMIRNPYIANNLSYISLSPFNISIINQLTETVRNLLNNSTNLTNKESY